MLATSNLSPLRLIVVAAALATAVMSVSAHHVWIEQDAQGATLYFGEFHENTREVSPGLLDKFGKPEAKHLGAKGAAATEMRKTATGFALAARAAAGESVIAQDAAYPSFEQKTGDKVARGIYVPAARLVADFSAREPQLLLDLVPAGSPAKNEVELKAFYRGQPLPKAKIELLTPFGWTREYHTDDKGSVRVSLPWKGTYVAEINHRDNKPSERALGDQSEKYDRASYVTSLTLTQPDGLAPLPAVPAAGPSKE